MELSRQRQIKGDSAQAGNSIPGENYHHLESRTQQDGRRASISGIKRQRSDALLYLRGIKNCVAPELLGSTMYVTKLFRN
jgi:hypothetical protein